MIRIKNLSILAMSGMMAYSLHVNANEELEKKRSAYQAINSKYSQFEQQSQAFTQRLMMILQRNPQAMQFFQMYTRMQQQKDQLAPDLYKTRFALMDHYEKLKAEGKLDRKQLIEYAGLLGELGSHLEQVSIYRDLHKKKKFEGAEALAFIDALQKVNAFEESITIAEYALSKKVEGRQKARFELALGQANFWLMSFDKAEEILAKVKVEPSSQMTVDRMKTMIKSGKEALKEEFDYRKKDKDLPEIEIKTSRGKIKAVLFEDDAPNAVANFITLAEKKYYDGQKWHRVLPNFMAQGGDPNSKDDDPSNDGSGGPGYTIKTDISKRKHLRGVLSYANAGKDTDGSQFFITTVPTNWLNGKHAVFGRVIEGQKIADSLQKGDAIESIRVLKKRKHDYKVKKGPDKG